MLSKLFSVVGVLVVVVLAGATTVGIGAPLIGAVWNISKATWTRTNPFDVPYGRIEAAPTGKGGRIICIPVDANSALCEDGYRVTRGELTGALSGLAGQSEQSSIHSNVFIAQ